ncbi:glycosyltransferase [Desulfobacter postgatei]|jgi:GT2 family glycosyltransferase|uniref:glycosyltransferase family 2 protein n=1 Tax=Desulfobacter postgatei TaxID=2293 RepID=UPI002A367EE9|nr:glycosyltransferase [Desulfobacter postgatei]MDX9963921.1 glycosyltransferase [Desulfobacter postgatei]
MIEQKTDTISVIIPTFNRVWTLKRAVDSALAQDYPHREIIVVDDGSTDGTRDLLAGYKDKIRVLVQENKGVSAARNLGIQESEGSFIALLDSDDAWETNKLSCQAAFFQSKPGAMICQTEEIWIRNGKRVNPKKKHKKPSGMIFEPSLKLCLVSPSAVMIRKQLFEQKGVFNEAFPVCEDYDLWLRVSHDTPVYLIDTPLTVKTGGHGDQLSAAHSQDKYRIQSILNLIESNVLSADQEQVALNVFKEKCRIFANGCMKRGREKEGAYYLMLAAGNK